MDHSLGILSIGGKTCITFGTFYDQLWASTTKGHKIFQLFLTSAC